MSESIFGLKHQRNAKKSPPEVGLLRLHYNHINSGIHLSNAMKENNHIKYFIQLYKQWHESRRNTEYCISWVLHDLNLHHVTLTISAWFIIKINENYVIHNARQA